MSSLSWGWSFGAGKGFVTGLWHRKFQNHTKKNWISKSNWNGSWGSLYIVDRDPQEPFQSNFEIRFFFVWFWNFRYHSPVTKSRSTMLMTVSWEALHWSETKDKTFTSRNAPVSSSWRSSRSFRSSWFHHPSCLSGRGHKFAPKKSKQNLKNVLWSTDHCDS